MEAAQPAGGRKKREPDVQGLPQPELVAAQRDREQTRGRGGVVPRAEHIAARGRRQAGSEDAVGDRAVRAGAERLRRDVERRDVGQDEVRHVRVQDHVGQRQARRPRRHQHRARERAQPFLGAGHHGHPEEPVRVPHGADGQRCARGAVPPAARAAQGQRLLCVEVFVRRQRSDRPEEHGDRRVLPSRRRAALLQVHRRHRAVRDGK